MFYVYETSTGTLVSVGSTVADPLPAGLSVVEGPDDASLQWDATSRALVPRAAVRVRTIEKSDFLRRLTLPVLAQVLARESMDPLIAALRVWIDNVGLVDLDTVEVQQGIAYLQQLGILTAEQAAAVLADGAA